MSEINRKKKEQNIKEIFKATLEITNNYGLLGATISKIASAAELSPATIYIYYKNKEDLMITTFSQVYKKIGEVAKKNLDEKGTIEDKIKHCYRNILVFSVNNRKYYSFFEQFVNTPYIQNVDIDEVINTFSTCLCVIKEGMAAGLIKPDISIARSFVFGTIIFLSNPYLCPGFKLTNEKIEMAAQSSWDAIRK